MVGDVESVAFVFTRPAFEVRQAEQDGGGNIYMTVGGIFAACTGKCLLGMSLLRLIVKMLRRDCVFGTDPRLTSWMCAAENTQMNR